MSSPGGPNAMNPLSAAGLNQYVNPPFYESNVVPTSQTTEFPLGTRILVGGVLYTYTAPGVWSVGGNSEATTTSFGIVELATLSELQNGNAPGNQVPTSNDVATVIAGVVAGTVPPANESQAGIAEIATQVETDAGTDDTRIVSPLKLATYIASGSGNGSFVDLTATGTVSFTGATGAYSITSATASDVGVTGAGIDLTIDSAAGQLILTGGEAAANAVRIQADDAAGGIDIDSGSAGIAIDSTGAISLDAAAASNFSVTGAGNDLNLASSAGRIIATAGEDAADAIYLRANAGTSETIRLHADQGTGAASIHLESDVGGITLTSGLASNDAVNVASSGGFDLDAALQVNIASSQNAADAIVINASAGGIDITNTGTAGEDIDIASSGASVNISSTENAAQAIYIRANGGTSETVDIHADQGTGVASINVHSDVGGVTVASGLASADAINITASNAGGGIDIDSGTAGFIVDTTGGISLDAAAASNFTVTGAADLTLSSTAGSVVVSSAEAVADAIQLTVSDAAGGITATVGTGDFNVTGGDIVAATGGITTTTGAITSATTLTATLGDITATDGNLVLGTAGNKIESTSVATTTAAGANSFGTVTLVGGTATVATTAITTNSIVYLTRQTIGATGAAALGLISRGTIVNGTSFVINALDPADATALIASDVSNVGWMIVN